jgi:hypothetical protein
VNLRLAIEEVKFRLGLIVFAGSVIQLRQAGLRRDDVSGISAA